MDHDIPEGPSREFEELDTPQDTRLESITEMAHRCRRYCEKHSLPIFNLTTDPWFQLLE